MINFRKAGLLLILICIIAGVGIFLMRGKEEKKTDDTAKSTVTEKKSNDQKKKAEDEKKPSLIDVDGETLQSRIKVPDGYERTKEKNGSLGDFLRNYKLIFLPDIKKQDPATRGPAYFYMEISGRRVLLLSEISL